MPEPSILQISISELRKDALAVTLGYAAFLLIPFGLVATGVSIALPQSLLSPIHLATFAVLLATGIATHLLEDYTRSYIAGSLKLLIGLIAGCLTVELLFGGSTLAMLYWSQVGDPSEADWLPPELAILFTLLMVGAMLYVVQVRPALAALRLLRARIPPHALRFTTAMEPFRGAKADLMSPGTKAGHRRLALALQLGGAGLIVIPLALLFWVTVFLQLEHLILSIPFAFGAMLLGAVLRRRGYRLSSLDAREALRTDMRAPVLYLRSFMDDAEALGEVSFRATTKHRRVNPILFWLRYRLALGTRLEEVLSKGVRHFGPFVAIGNPNERLPELGAARSYHTNETWQDAIKQWVNMAQLIVQVAGPTSWIRWELDTILACGAGAKLILLFPPGARGDHHVRWGNVQGALQETPWSSTFGKLDPDLVLGVRLLKNGGLRVISGARREIVDYTLAIRLLLAPLDAAARI